MYNTLVEQDVIIIVLLLKTSIKYPSVLIMSWFSEVLSTT